jgi:TatA/E family protein of Tat protein translocase
LFGVGPQELLIIGLLVLVVFGPKRLPSMARDFGRFIQEAQRFAEDFSAQHAEGHLQIVGIGEWKPTSTRPGWNTEPRLNEEETESLPLHISIIHY